MNEIFFKKFRIDELKILDFNYWVVSVRPKQPTPGSLVISLKRECARLGSLTSAEAKELQDVYSRTENLLQRAYNYDQINYLCLMMVDKQVHFHVIPRFSQLVHFNGKNFQDQHWPGPPDVTSFIQDDNFEKNVWEYLIKSAGTKNKIIGYTTGVYDLFHIGHLNVLKRAKEHCDYLIVGVTSDELSMLRKNKKPIIELKERMAIVGSLKFVDEVVIQEHMDKMDAWKKYHFDRMFVGDDWKGSEKWNRMEAEFKAVGTEIIYFPYTASTSSTIIRKVLNEVEVLN